MQLLSGSDQQMEIFEKVVISVVSYMPPNPTGSSWKHFISVQILPCLSIWSNRELQCLADHAGCDPISWLYLQFGSSTVSSSKWLHRMDKNKAIPTCWINTNGRIQKRKVHTGRLRLTLWVAAVAGFHHGSVMHAVITTAFSSLCVAATPQVADTAFLIVMEKSWCDWISQDCEYSKT